jgi:hypothetical protein
MSTDKAKQNTQSATQELWHVAETDDSDRVESLLANGAEINASNAQGMTALMRAAAGGRVRMVRVLLKHGADPNSARNDKFTALMLAAFFGHQEVVRILVEHGGDTDATTRFGTSAKVWAASRTFKGVVQYLEHPRASQASSNVATVANTCAGSPREATSVKRDENLNYETPGIPTESSFEEVGSLAALGAALNEGVAPSGNDPSRVQQSSPDFSVIHQFRSRLQPVNRSIRVYAWTALLLFIAVFAHLALEQRQRDVKLITQTHSPVAIEGSAVLVSPSVADNLPTSVEVRIAPSDAQADKMALGDAAATNSKKTNTLKPRLSGIRVLPVRDNGSGNTSKSPNPTSISQSTSTPEHTADVARSTEFTAAAASTPRPRPAVSRESMRMNNPAPLTTELITGSKTPNGRVIQWP